MQADPLGYAGGTNLYAYASNSPINIVDPLGMIGTCSGGATLCDAVTSALGLVQAAAAAAAPGSASRAGLDRAVQFLGGPNVDVVFGQIGPNYAAGAYAYPRTNTVKIVINPAEVTSVGGGGVNTAYLGGILVHEGAGHGADMLKLGVQAPTSLSMERYLEYSAYSLEQNYYQALGMSARNGLWQQGWSPILNAQDAANSLAFMIGASVDVWNAARGGPPPAAAPTPEYNIGYAGSYK